MDELKNAGSAQRQSVRSAQREAEEEDIHQVATEAVGALDNASYVHDLTNALECHLDLQQICDALQQDRNVRETIRRMMEILIQKDQEWLNEEAANDMRVFFFILVLNSLTESKVDYDKQTAMEELEKHRHDENFLDAIVAALPEVIPDIERFGTYLRSNLSGAQNPPTGEDVLDDINMGLG